MVEIRELLSVPKLMQTLPLHSLLQRGSMSLQTVLMHWTIIVPTVYWNTNYAGSISRNLSNFRRIFITLNYVDIAKNMYVCRC